MNSPLNVMPTASAWPKEGIIFNVSKSVTTIVPIDAPYVMLKACRPENKPIIVNARIENAKNISGWAGVNEGSGICQSI